VTIIAAGLFSGCVAYQPRPIEPVRIEAELRERTLTDPGLRTYVEAYISVKPLEWPPQTWDLTTLTLVALYYHPDLDTARARLESAEAGIVTAAGRPNPSLSTSTRYSTNGAPGLLPWTFGLTFDILIETAGKRSYRIAQAEHLTEAARLDLAATAWQVRSRVRAALLEHLLAVRDLDLLRAQESVRAEAVSFLERRFEVGEVSRPDVDAVQTELANTKLALRTAEGRIAESQVALAAALGLPGWSLDGATLVWPELDTPPTEETLSPATLQRAGLLNRLDVRRTLADYAAAEAALQLEVVKQYPDIQLGPGFLFEEGEDKPSLSPSSLVLPLLNQNQGPIAEAEANRKGVAARFLALQAHIISDTASVLARYRAALAELAEAETALVSLRAQEGALQRMVELGGADRLTLAGLRVQRAIAERARLSALGKTQGALGALEDAVQRPLDSTAPLPEISPASPRKALEQEEEE
jgi:outer membrane protein TolC